MATLLERQQGAWRNGQLLWKLRKHQNPIYYAVWNVINNTNPTLKYVINCSRRFGKTFTLLVIAIEFALRKPNMQVRYAAPTLVQLRKIIFPIIRTITAGCPEDIKPQFKTVDNVLVFTNGSEIHFAGTDGGHAESLRGTASDLNILDEAGSMDELDYIIQSILLPQTLTTGGKTIIASTPSVTPSHDYYQIYQTARDNDNLIEFTIYDNTSLSTDMIETYKIESGGDQSTTWLREYMCKFVVDQDLAIIPEWSVSYIDTQERDEFFTYYHKYVAMDLGVRDFTAALFGYYDFRKVVLYVEDEIVINGPEMTTNVLVTMIKDKELQLWQEQQPYKRVADNNNLLLVQDLTLLHNLPFFPTSKDQLEAMINETRMWVQQGKVIVNPKCVNLIGCLEYGVWRKSNNIKVEFGRSTKYGHYDALAALVYLVRNIDTYTNPVPYMHGVSQLSNFIRPHSNVPDNIKAIGNAMSGVNTRQRRNYK